MTRDFPRALELGGAGAFARLYARQEPARAKIGWLASADLSAVHLTDLAAPAFACDEEFLPLADQSLDLVIAPLSLHAVNDLPGALVQIRRALKPDGLFLGAMLGGATLTELRQCLLAAEVELTGGAGARVAPFADAMDLSGLLQRAGFALPVADLDRHAVTYAQPLKLLSDLRAMGETAALAERQPRALTRAVLFKAVELYQSRFAAAGGRVSATFEILYAAGWAPADSQPKPLRPGSAQTRLADALGATERSAGEKAGPAGTMGPKK